MSDVINFLASLYEKGLSYSVIKSAKASLNLILAFPPYSSIGEHPLIIKFMKGVFNTRPPTRKFGFVWDVKILFDYFRELGDNENLKDDVLSHKILLLLVLLGGQRINTIFWFRTDELICNDLSATFAPSHVLKHSNENRKQDIFEYRAYHDKKLCVIACLRAYLARRNTRVQSHCKKLLITHKKPYHEASIDTLRRWVKTLFNNIGIFNFSAHSCRSASTSKALAIGIDIDEILKKGCWSNEKTFFDFYKKDIIYFAKDEPFNEIIN